MRKKLTHNLGLKLAALLCAIGLWLVAVNINDPVTQNTYTVSVQLQNVNSFTNAGKYVEVLDDTDSIRVTVRASRSFFTSFSEKNIVATADLEEMTEDNLLPIEITTTKADSKIESIRKDKDYVKVNIENVMKLQKRISVKVVNEPGEGYLLGNISTDQNAVIISGPESIVEKIDSVAVEVNVDGATSDVNITLPIHLYDKEGHEVDDSKLTKSVQEVFTTASILQIKEVPIEYTVVGEPAEEYIFTGNFVKNPASVMIAAKPSVLRNVNSILVEGAVNLDGAAGNVEIAVGIKEYLPEGTILADNTNDGMVAVTALVEKEAVRIIDLPMEQIILTNVPEGYKAKLRGIVESTTVKLGGLASQLDAMDMAALQGTIDVGEYINRAGEENIAMGSHYPKASFVLPEYVYLKDDVNIHIVLEED